MILVKTVPVALAEVPMAIIPSQKLRSNILLYALEILSVNLLKMVGRSGYGTKTLMSNEISEFKSPLPDLDAQREAAIAIQNIETKKKLRKEKRQLLQDLFSTLLHELMTAKTRLDQSPVEFK